MRGALGVGFYFEGYFEGDGCRREKRDKGLRAIWLMQRRIEEASKLQVAMKQSKRGRVT